MNTGTFKSLCRIGPRSGSVRPHRRSDGRAWPGVAALLLTIGTLPTAQANLLVNGSFEEPVVPAAGFTNFLGGSTAITGWTVVGVDSAVTSGSFVQSGITFQAQSGAQFIDLAGVVSNSKASGVTQTVATTTGTLYRLAFYVGSATDNFYFFPTTVDVSIDGGARASFLNSSAPIDHLDWRLFSLDFTALGSSTEVTFYNGGEAYNFSSALDNVSLDAVTVTTPVPEPAEWALMGVGLAALVSRRRLRR